VNGSFTENAQSFVNLVSTVDEIFQVGLVCLSGGLVKILQHVTSVLVFSDVERTLSESSRCGLGAKLDQTTRSFEVSKIGGDVQG